MPNTPINDIPMKKTLYGDSCHNKIRTKVVIKLNNKDILNSLGLSVKTINYLFLSLFSCLDVQLVFLEL